nr:MAG TPA: hypothetical protein [Caudoviricetes sp.]
MYYNTCKRYSKEIRQNGTKRLVVLLKNMSN